MVLGWTMPVSLMEDTKSINVAPCMDKMAVYTLMPLRPMKSEMNSYRRSMRSLFQMCLQPSSLVYEPGNYHSTSRSESTETHQIRKYSLHNFDRRAPKSLLFSIIGFRLPSEVIGP